MPAHSPADAAGTNDPSPAVPEPSRRFIGRQPIFDRQENVFGYELLFRSGATNAYDGTDGDSATTQVIHNSLNVMGLSSLAGGKKAFVNVTRGALLDGSYTLLPTATAVIELLEDIEPDEEVVAACREVRKQGYTLALDDLVTTEGYGPLLELADIVKVDFMGTSPQGRAEIGDVLARHRAALLAEKIETREEFDEALALGYAYFQGYFFQKPQVISAKDVPPFARNYLVFLQRLAEPDLNFDRLEAVVKQDVALSTKLLRYLNSAHFGLSREVRSIKQAMVLLGERPLRKWAAVVAVTCLGREKPEELAVNALIRANFCERLASLAKLAGRELDLFMMGLLSLIDAMTDRPREEVLAEFPLPADVAAALDGSQSLLGVIHQIACCIERHEPVALEALCQRVGVTPEVVSESYERSVRWADSVFAE